MPTLTWIGKDKVINHHQAVPYCTLEKQYQYGDSDTENKIIHGDNLLALKALLPQYEGRIKCIYIDPPYNTGNENWVYNDNVNSPQIKKWLGQVVGKEGEDLSRHDKWLCMMYPRLQLLQELLADNGVIFISIDDNEQANLRLLCNEIFGAENFIAQIIWERAYAPVNLKKHFSESHDYMLCYAKNKKLAICNGLIRNDEANRRYSNPDNDPRGDWTSGDLSVGPRVESKVYEITTPKGRKILPPSGYCWRVDKETYEQYVADGRIWFGEDGNNVPRIKRFLAEVKQGITPMTIWKYGEVGHSQDATKELKAIFGGEAVFTYPKSIRLIERALGLYATPNDIFLDSFAGSGTTAHAILDLNKKDGGNRKFILVEMEDYAETITAERVRRVINGYGDGKNENTGTGGGFSFYELGESLMIGEYINEKQPTEKIQEYIWYTETRTPFVSQKHKYYLGKHQNVGYYFYYEKNKITALGYDTLNIVKERADQYIIYADQCLISEDDLRAKNIIFKKIPRDIRKF